MTRLVLVVTVLATLAAACSSTERAAPVDAGGASPSPPQEAGDSGSGSPDAGSPGSGAPGTTGTSAPATPADAVLASLQPADTVIRFDFSAPITYDYVKGEKKAELVEFQITADGTGIACETDQMRYRQLQVSRKDLVTALDTILNAGFVDLPPQVGPVVTTRRVTQVLGTGTIRVAVAPGAMHTVTFEGLFSELATNGIGSMPEKPLL